MSSSKPLNEIYNSFGVAIGFTLAGVIFAGAPTYLSASKGWSICWYVIASVFGLFGLVAGLVEFGELRGSEAASRFGVAFLLEGLSALFFILTHSGYVSGSASTVLKVISLFIAALGSLVIGTGIGSWLHRRSTEQPKTTISTKPQISKTPDKIVSLLVALIGLATAVVGFIAAIHKQ